ncbi:hypothetical protein [Acidaminobacter hydrogenoformans]|uniref:Uncharacterized protein n=1 Tax=Acidaminobacter hydrogenoformans DSM 2784 TaxID=1120920 RepID=A0A1G5RX75_9FIRM|nr:hypothetical protein [Acidaminobacter hydrogenoformans]SCZ78606.1 hypothetical protein SAMN03080599_01340 [Acidaminobacter hydrogenoformans DSM 2784]
MWKKLLALSLVLILALSFAACGGDGDIAEEASAAWSEATGDQVKSAKAEKYGSGMSESHQIMAAFILKRNDRDSNLEAYKEVFLVTIVLETGEEYGMVVADGEMIFPENIGG